MLTYRQGVDLRPAYDRLNAADNKLRRLELELLPELRALDGDPVALDWLLLERYEPEGYHRGQAKTSADTRSIAYSGARWLVVKITDLIALAGGEGSFVPASRWGSLMVFLGWSGQGSNALHALMRIQQAGMEFRPTINQLFGYARISVNSPSSVFDTPMPWLITARLDLGADGGPTRVRASGTARSSPNTRRRAEAALARSRWHLRTPRPPPAFIRQKNHGRADRRPVSRVTLGAHPGNVGLTAARQGRGRPTPRRSSAPAPPGSRPASARAPRTGRRGGAARRGCRPRRSGPGPAR